MRRLAAIACLSPLIAIPAAAQADSTYTAAALEPMAPSALAALFVPDASQAIVAASFDTDGRMLSETTLRTVDLFAAPELVRPGVCARDATRIVFTAPPVDRQHDRDPPVALERIARAKWYAATSGAPDTSFSCAASPNAYLPLRESLLDQRLSLMADLARARLLAMGRARLGIAVTCRIDDTPRPRPCHKSARRILATLPLDRIAAVEPDGGRGDVIHSHSPAHGAIDGPDPDMPADPRIRFFWIGALEGPGDAVFTYANGKVTGISIWRTQAVYH